MAKCANSSLGLQSAVHVNYEASLDSPFRTFKKYLTEILRFWNSFNLPWNYFYKHLPVHSCSRNIFDP